MHNIFDHAVEICCNAMFLITLQVQGVLKDVMSDLQQTNLEKTLLAWCRQTTKVGEEISQPAYTWF